MRDVGDGEDVLRRRLGKVPDQVVTSSTNPVSQRERHHHEFTQYSLLRAQESLRRAGTQALHPLGEPSSRHCQGLRAVSPVQDVSWDDAMGSTEPGAKLGEENVGSNSQQESLLLYEAITTSIKRRQQASKK